MNDALDRMYRWYVLGCRQQEQEPMSREEFAEQRLLQVLSGSLLASEVFDRTAAEWELAREDAQWTSILQRLSRLSFLPAISDLVKAVQVGRESDEDDDAGSAGVPATLPPFLPVLVGAGAKLHPDLDPEPQWRNP